VGALGVVEPQRAGERVQHAFGYAAHVSALKAGVVRDADAGEDGDLLAAEPRDAARAVRHKPDLVWSNPAAAGGQELPDLALGVHDSRVDPPGCGWETLPVPLSTGTLTSRDLVLSWM